MFVENPTKEQFQELIDFCQRDYLPSELEIWPHRAEEHVRKILYDFSIVRSNALKEMKSLAAFDWLNGTNSGNKHDFEEAMAIFPFEKRKNLGNWVEEKTLSITGYLDKWFQKIQEIHDDDSLKNLEVIKIDGCITDTGYFRTEESLKNTTRHEVEEVQKYEYMVAHIAQCLMKYIYPEKGYKSEFRPHISKIITALKDVKNLQNELNGYEEFSYLPMEIKDKQITNKIDFYTEILEKDSLPFSRKDIYHNKRMFIVAVTKGIPLNSIRNRDVIKAFNKYCLKFVTPLLNLSCFGEPMEESSVRRILKLESSRREKNAISFNNSRKI